MQDANHILGIVGCREPDLAVRLFELLIARTPALRDQEHAHVLISSDCGARLNRSRQARSAELVDLVGSAKSLTAAGATMLVLPGETDIGVMEAMQQEFALPVLDWVEVAVRAARDLSGPTALVAQSDVLASRVYQDHFGRSAGACLVPSADRQRLIDNGTSTTTSGRREVLASVIDQMADQGAVSALVASEELAAAIEPDTDLLRIPVIDPAAAMAEYVLGRARPDGSSRAPPRHRPDRQVTPE